MSLKSFHVFFIIVAALFCAAMSVWAFRGSSEEVMGNGAAPFGFGAIIAAVALFAYAMWFAFSKSKTIA